MKKVLSLFLCLTFVLLSCSLSLNVFATSLSDGTVALNAQMLDGECPDGLDYVYFAPDTTSSKKYPLVIWLHGAKSGEYKRAQLESYNFCDWSSVEFQARFCNAGGAFLLLPRSSNNVSHNWYTTSTSALKTTIDYFIAQYGENIDKTRIYIAGYSTGGSMVYYMLNAYPGFFAAAMPICSLYAPTSVELEKLSDTSMWLFSCDKDPYLTANTASTDTVFQYLKQITNRKDGVRHTSFTQAVWPTGAKQNAIDGEHYIWGAVINDMFMYTGEQYLYSTTKDATSKTITFTSPVGLINWLSQQSTPETSKSLSFFDKIANFFKSIYIYIIALFS